MLPNAENEQYFIQIVTDMICFFVFSLTVILFAFIVETITKMNYPNNNS